MKPLNETEKKKATNKFVGLFILSMLLIFGASYFIIQLSAEYL